MKGITLALTVLGLIIGVVMVFTALAETAHDMDNAADNLTYNESTANDTFPLMGFFGPKGIVLLALVVGVVATLLVAFRKLSG